LNNQSGDLLEGIEDWSDFELGQDGSEESTNSVPEPVPLCQSFVKCRVEKVEGDAQWNSLKRRMERRVEVVLKSDDNQHKTLVLCDEWTELSLDQGNPLNIVSFPGSPPINFQLDPLVFSRAEPGHVLILFPSLLISATVVSNAPFCSRRSVLSTRLKISSTEIGEPIVRGNIVHEVIQNSLLPTQEEDQSNPALQPTPNIPDTWEITRLSEEARKACIRHLSDLFMIGKSADEGVKMVSEHLQQLPSWSNKYLINRKENGKIILNVSVPLIN
jgi:DNA replication ATP-dependent helicase Dna2